MGKRLIQQARGKGGPTYRAPSFRYVADVKTPNIEMSGIVQDILRCPGHSAPLAKIVYSNQTVGYMVAAENLKVGDKIDLGTNIEEIKTQNTLALKHIPEGTPIFNIESQPGDGGKFARSGGVNAKVLSHSSEKVIIMLPSKKQKSFHPDCRAIIGVVSGGGRVEKPLLKAGAKFYKMKAKNKLWPKVSGGAMNAVDHPFGNKRSSRKSKAKPAPNNAPPGRKVGMIRPKRTGRSK